MKIALYRTSSGSTIILKSEMESEPFMREYARISEIKDVDFTMLSEKEIAGSQAKAISADIVALQNQIKDLQTKKDKLYEAIKPPQNQESGNSISGTS